MKVSTAIRAIEEHGVLLVYPMPNRPEPRSLWSVLYPDLAMKWAWDEFADREVGEMWRLRERLAHSDKVVYGKWYQGRATFFSSAVFTAMLARLRSRGNVLAGIGRNGTELLELLEESSPVSTKDLRTTAMESGRFATRVQIDQTMKELWQRLLIVGVGEVADGAFPSLSVGATSLILEPTWLATERTTAKGERALDAVFAKAPLIAKAYGKVLDRVAAQATPLL